VLRVKAMAESMGHDLVHQDTFVPCTREVKYALGSAERFE
jgi:hypothetical protein